MHASPFNRSRAGFTLVEALIVIVVLGILVGALAPVVSRQISHSRVNNAAQLLAADLESALSLAGRQRTPVRMTVDPAQRAVLITDRASGTIITRRSYGPDSEFKVETLSASPSSTDLLPQGRATSAATLTVGIGSYSRQVMLTRAGLVRVQQ
ncbi:MAG TPA: GspH/FimT family pseudopilin [Gemmatimonadaceae bacterium]|nr:GspH/FimT family pseudopilin [Gemmatimonadaceae bacterium]